MGMMKSLFPFNSIGFWSFFVSELSDDYDMRRIVSSRLFSMRGGV